MTETGASTVVLLRHAATDLNTLDVFQGQCDTALSPDGFEQAKDAARQLSSIQWGTIVTSPQRRARQTCEFIERAARRHHDGEVADIRERNLAQLDRQFKAAAEAANPGVLHKLVADPDYAPLGGESLRDVANRARRALPRIANAAKGPALAVTHGGVIHALRLCSTQDDQDGGTGQVAPAHALIVTVRGTAESLDVAVVAANVKPSEVHHHLRTSSVEMEREQ